jgi:hypothetical protein
VIRCGWRYSGFSFIASIINYLHTFSLSIGIRREALLAAPLWWLFAADKKQKVYINLRLISVIAGLAFPLCFAAVVIPDHCWGKLAYLMPIQPK